MSCFSAISIQRSAVLAAFGLVFLERTFADDWPRWRGPTLNGISAEREWTASWLKEGPKRLWKASVGTGFSSVTVADGRLFTLGNRDETDTVYCFDAGTGKELWKHSYPCALDPKYYEGGPGSTPTVDNGKVFTLSKRGHLFCFEAATGKVIWQKNLIDELDVKKPEWGFSGSVLIQDDSLILNVGDAGTAVDKRNGRILWTSGTGLSGYATPVPFKVGGEPHVIIYSGKALVCVRVQDGKELWSYPWTTRWNINAADPIISGDKIFISSFERCALLQVSASGPNLIWENKDLANHFNACVLIDGYLYGMHGNTDQAQRELRCLEIATGKILWQFDGLGLGSLSAAAGKLIVLSERGELVVAQASPDAFQPIARAQVLGGKCWTVPVLANGRIYCRNAVGDLVCVDVHGTGKP